jgi:hypothetical protein
MNKEIKVWTKCDGIVYTKHYKSIEHFYNNTVMYENFFITTEGIMINISEVIKAKEKNNE